VGNFVRPFGDSLYHGVDRVETLEEIRQLLLSIYDQKKSSVIFDSFYASAFTSFGKTDTEFDLLKYKQFDPLKDLILNRAKQLVEDQATYIGINKANKKLVFSEIWFNVNPPQGYQGKHHHADYLLGGTYYIQVPKNSGIIRFYNPNNYAQFKLYSPTVDHLMKLVADVETAEGHLLIWPGFIDHEVTTNLTEDKLRITISFCLDWES
jgi:uncharacterized protein (TIGR02466 family)